MQRILPKFINNDQRAFLENRIAHDQLDLGVTWWTSSTEAIKWLSASKLIYVRLIIGCHGFLMGT